MNTDITIQERGDDQLRAAHHSFRHLVEHSPFGIYAVDSDFRLVLVSAGARKVFENIDPLLGRDFADVLRIVWPEPFASETIAIFRRVLETGEPYHAPTTVEKRNDIAAVESYDWKVERIVLPDGYPGVVCHFYDLSERQRYEEKLRASEERLLRVHRQSPAGIVETDATGRMTMVNARWCEMLGYTEAELLQMAVIDVTHERSREATLQSVGLLAAGGPDFQIEKCYRRKDGKALDAHSSVSALWSPDKKFLGLIAVVLDITERNRAEDKLRENEAEFRAVFELSPVGKAQLDMNGHFIRVNSKFCDLTGFLAEELAGMKSTDLDFLDDLDADSKNIERMLRGEVESYEVEKRYVRRDGRILWVQVNATLLRTAEGHPERTTAVIQDITVRKQTEEKLRESEERKSAILSASLDAIITMDHEGIIADFNPAAEQTFGYRPEDAIGQPLAELIIPERLRQSHYEGLARYLATGHGPVLGQRIELPGLHAEGYEFPAEISITRITGLEPPMFTATLRDITERKQSEADLLLRTAELYESVDRYRAATAAVSDLIWTNNAEGLMEGEQPGWANFTGQSLEEYQGFGWAKAIHPEDSQPTIEAWMRAVAEKFTFIFEHRVLRYDGEWRDCSIRAVPTLNSDGSIREWVGVHTDITERKRNENKLQQLAADLAEADLRKDEFLATLAHELRNPLAPILNGLELMKLRGGQDASVEEVHSMMERQLTQMVRLVDDLMDVSRISRGNIDLRKERISLAEVLNSAVETSRPLIEQMGHELNVTLPKQPIILDADMTRLAQVFLNLLNNAAKYSDRGSHIWLNVERQGSEVVVAVKDSGIGIAVDQLPRIFDMFTQLDRSLEKSQSGLGIGLTLVKRLVEMHGGTIEARSEGLAKGCEFVVRLPVVIGASKPLKLTNDGEQSAKSSLRILIVDDNVDLVHVLSLLLETIGNEIRVAHNGQEGVEMAEEFRPDVIVLDIGLPVLNGYEACRRIREQSWGKNVVLIASTGWGGTEDRRRSQEAGFDHHMVKPVDMQAMMKILIGLQTAKQTSGSSQSTR